MSSDNMPPNEGRGKLSVTVRKFNGTDIGQRADGYLNATAMCKASGREWSKYWETDTAKAFVEELVGSLQIRRDLLIVSVLRGPNASRGTWVHPQVAYHLAQWCSPAFAVQVTEWIHDIRTKGYAAAPGVEIDREDLAGRISTLERVLATMVSLVQSAAQAPPATPVLPGFLRLTDYLAAKGIDCLAGRHKRVLSKQVRRFCETRGFRVEDGAGNVFRASPAYPIFAIDCWWSERGEKQVRALVASIQAKKQVRATPLFAVLNGGPPATA